MFDILSTVNSTLVNSPLFLDTESFSPMVNEDNSVTTVNFGYFLKLITDPKVWIVFANPGFETNPWILNSNLNGFGLIPPITLSTG